MLVVRPTVRHLRGIPALGFLFICLTGADSRPHTGPVEPSEPPGGRRPCAEIVRRADRLRRRDPTRLVEVVDVGRELNQDFRWVERCMKLYGRRPLKQAPQHEETREEEEERWETGEAEEIGHEETRDAREEGREIVEKQRILKVKPPPTPQSIPEEWDN
jgi:hypothetical protein